jgi:hypothetical protein
MSMRFSFWVALLCFVLGLVNVGFCLWNRDLNSLGGWVSAVCGWGIVVLRSRDE